MYTKLYQHKVPKMIIQLEKHRYLLSQGRESINDETVNESQDDKGGITFVSTYLDQDYNSILTDLEDIPKKVRKQFEPRSSTIPNLSRKRTGLGKVNDGIYQEI
jgi:hypothetical protein